MPQSNHSLLFSTLLWKDSQANKFETAKSLTFGAQLYNWVGSLGLPGHVVSSISGIIATSTNVATWLPRIPVTLMLYRRSYPQRVRALAICHFVPTTLFTTSEKNFTHHSGPVLLSSCFVFFFFLSITILKGFQNDLRTEVELCTTSFC